MKKYVDNMYKYEGNMKEYVENMKEYVKNMKEYVKNTKKHVENMKKYVDKDLALPYLYGPWDLEKFRFLSLYMGFGTWQNSTPELPSQFRNLEKYLEKFRASP